ncbi:MAG: hypothetical protein WD652_04130 [Acidimicrobiia bacterium]
MRQRGLVVVLTLVVAACGGGDGSSNPLDTTSTAPGATSIATTTTNAPTTTLPPTTTTTVDPFLVDIYSIEPTPSPEATGVNAVLGGPPDEIATRLILADLEDDGIDLTGVEIYVWPISGTGESLVVIEFGDSAGLYAEDDDQATLLVNSVLTHPVVAEQNITRLVLKIAGTDEEGPYVFTMTALVEDMLRSLSTGASLEEGEAQFELERPEP